MTTLALASFSTLEMWLIAVVLFLVFLFWRLTRHQACGYRGEPDSDGL